MSQAKVNGVDIEFEIFGRDSDPAILLIMGYAAQLTLWPEPMCRGLADKGFRVIRFDNRDVGKSTHLMEEPAPDSAVLMNKLMTGQPFEIPYSLDDMAADAVGLLDAIGIEQAHIVGASMGGMIAQLVAVNHPSRARSLISIMSTTGRRDLPPAKPEVMAALVTPPASTRRDDLIESAVRTWRVIGSPGYPRTDTEIRKLAEEEVDRTPYEPTGFARQMAAIIAAPPRNEILKGVRAPTLVIHGADDPLLPVAGGEDTAASIPGAELIVIPGAGHEFPDSLISTYVRHIGDFVSKVEARVKTS
ncbi:alpha/beta fold hydrolase [Methylocapsa sp. S129]|uniref:alpha/beta fold hydrolase n=1 Tax=Methylocapsa sp. S129 TaxID=1641869 RepID=UPI00131BC39A|nr:alpha/beta fold hydrolase [Methylocapsa sp. S129]